MNHIPGRRMAALLVLALLWPPLAGPAPSQAAPSRAVSVRDGRWSDPSVWNPRGVPRGGAAVTIGKGTTVTYDVASAEELAALSIEGTLTFSRERSTRLDVGNVYVRDGGVLEMGSARQPIPAAVSLELRIVVPPGAAYKGGGFVEGDIGLWVFAGGRWEAHGAPVSHSWTTLARPAPAGSTTVYVLDSPSDWRAGSEVLITPTTAAPADADFEERRLAGVRRLRKDLFEVRLTAPLSRTHEGEEGVAGEVALLTRNVRVMSKYPDRTRAHTAYLKGSRGGLAYVEFSDLGTFGVLGRYPVHFHRMGDSSRGMTARGLSIRRSGNHFLNVHASNGITIEDVVGFDVAGSGFFLESATLDGGETDGTPHDAEEGPPPSPRGGRQRPNRQGERERVPIRQTQPENVDITFIHNLAAKGVWRSGSLDRPNVALFWISTLNTILIDNVAVGARGGKNNAGFHVTALTVRSPSGTPFVMVGNEARGNDDHGFLAWLNGKDVFDVVEFRGRRNGRTGMTLGAYVPRYRIFRAELAQNGEANVSAWMTRAWVQDSVLSDAPVGVFFNRHFTSTDPEDPALILNVRFARHSTADVSQDHHACPVQGEEQSAYSRRCPANYALFLRPDFGSARAVDFGWHANAYSWFEILNPMRSLPGAPAQFRVFRRDREGEGSLYQPFDARIRPVQRQWDAPPGVEITLLPQGNGRPVLAQIRARDDRGVAAVEVFMDGRLLRRLTAPPFTVPLPAHGAGGSRGYVYARATDSGGNVGYSPLLRLHRSLP